MVWPLRDSRINRWRDGWWTELHTFLLEKSAGAFPVQKPPVGLM